MPITPMNSSGTDSAKSLITAKGDILTHNGSALAKITLGANGTLLQADSSDPEGMVWTSIVDNLTTNSSTATLSAAQGKVLQDTKCAVGNTAGTSLGTASAGTANTAARSDHVHPSVPFSGCRVYRSTNQSIPSSATTYVFWYDEHYDVGGYHSTSSNVNRLVAPYTGYYMLTVKVEFISNSVGSRYLSYVKNEALFPEYTLASIGTSNLGGSARLNGSDIVKLNAGDNLSVVLYQDSGGNLDITTGSFATMTYLGS